MKAARRAATGLAIAALMCTGSVAADKPNILWLTSEDHGPEMGCYGDENARTPFVDGLAAKGMLFTRAWSTAPVCAPARTAIITGLYTASSGGQHMRSMAPLPVEMKLFPQLLREAGYYCTNSQKEDYNVRTPESLWDESSKRAHWRRRNAEQPFFAVFNSTKSHESQIRSRPHRQIADPARVRIPAYHPDTPEVRQDWAQYYDKVSEADADAGRRLKELAAAGLDDDTIIFYFGDHGSGMPRSKRWPSDSGLHVPLVVFFPEKWRHLAPREYRPGGESDRLVAFVDFAPTVLSIAGVEPPAWMQGHAFAGPYQTAPQPYLFGERGRMDERFDLVRSVTDGRYVYIRNYFPHVSQGQHVSYQFETPTTRIWRDLFDQGRTTPEQSIFWKTPKAPEELYDLQSDPDEVRNLASSADHRQILQRLREAVRAHIVATADVCFLPEGEMHARSAGSTPYGLGRDSSKYPQARILAAAETASNLDPAALPELASLLDDDDSAVRYWAALGILMRGRAAVVEHETRLRQALGDQSPYVQIAAAEALGRYAGHDAAAAALDLLSRLAAPADNGVLVAMPALAAIETLGDPSASLRERVRRIDPIGPMPDARYSTYVPRLIENITGTAAAPRAIARVGATESLTAIDVLLLPDQTMIRHAQAANARLRENYPAGFALDATHHPHITLLQRYVLTKDLDAVYAAVEKVLNRQRPAGWQLEATGYYYLDFDHMALAGIVIRPTPQLLQLQQAIIDAVAPYARPDGTAAAYVTTAEHPEVNAPTLQYVNTFIPERNGKNYNPHVTVGVGQLEFVQGMKAAPFKDFKFNVAGAAVFHLGNYGTAQKQLWSWTAPGAKPKP